MYSRNRIYIAGNFVRNVSDVLDNKMKVLGTVLTVYKIEN